MKTRSLCGNGFRIENFGNSDFSGLVFFFLGIFLC